MLSAAGLGCDPVRLEQPGGIRPRVEIRVAKLEEGNLGPLSGSRCHQMVEVRNLREWPSIFPDLGVHDCRTLIQPVDGNNPEVCLRVLSGELFGSSQYTVPD